MNALISNDELDKRLANRPAPSVTLDLIKSKVRSCDYVESGVLTIAVVSLENGYTVTGQSACADPANYDPEIGRKIAFDNALKEVWPLEGYLLRQRLHDGDGLAMTATEAMQGVKRQG